MSRDIRSFFTVGAKKAPATQPTSDSKQKKKKSVIDSSDEDEPGRSTKITAKSVKTPSTSNKRRIVYSDDDDNNTPNAKKPNLSKPVDKPKQQPKLKLVEDVTDMFGDEPIKRVDKPAASKTMTEEEINSHFMDDLDVSAVLDMDVDVDVNNVNGRPKEVESFDDSNVIESTPKVNKPKGRTEKKASAKKASLDTSVLSDEDRHERKRQAAMLYQQYKNRSGPALPGSKDVPKGKPNCLNGLVFVLTGVYESLERDEMADIIKEYGGKVTTSLSKKTTYIVVGEEAGLAKIAKADDLGTKRLTEDGLLDLIRVKSGLPPKEAQSGGDSPAKDKKSPASKDSSKDNTPSKVKKSTTPRKLNGSKVSPNKIKEENKTPKKEQQSSSNVNGKHLVNQRTIPTKESSSSASTSVSSRNAKFEKSDDITVDRKPSEHQLNIASVDNQAWVEKYKPTNIKQIIGQQGAASNVVKLQNWLNKWYDNHNGKKKLQKPNPWAKNDDGSYYKAALLSGPPGVGKTTTATLVAKELGFYTVEMNASDTRSKRMLKEEVSELLSNKSLAGYFNGSNNATTTKKHVLIMDEVDGMAGNEDRGGIQELISLIKESSIPIICMCNDRNHQKMRSLVNYCYDLRFSRPRLEQIRGAMLSICFKEKFKLNPQAIDEIISATNNDIRQTINHLTLMSANNSITLSETKQDTAKKDMKLGPWDVVRKVFSADEHKTMSLADKADLFFHDYSMGPLFVQQNYLIVAPKVAKTKIPAHVAMTADSLSLGDLVESRIRSKNAWSMLPIQAMYSSVLPGEYMAGNITAQINFPGWLGKYSKSNKRKRLAQELHDHTRIRTSGSRLSIRLDYAPFLIEKIVKPLRDRGMDGVEEALSVLKEYRLLREDIDSLIELTMWPGKKNPMDAIEGKVKAALTRAYNKEVTPYTYTANAAVKKKKAEKSNDEFENGYADDEDGGIAPDGGSDEEDNDGVESDVLIKAKKKPASTKGSDAASGSKKAGSSSRKAKK